MKLADKLELIAALAYCRGYFKPTLTTPRECLPGVNRGMELLTRGLEIVHSQKVEYDAPNIPGQS